MSNAMSRSERSKSRWKGALLAAVATAVVTPLAAKAQSMSVGIYANPLGGATSPNVYSGFNNVYIDPYDTDTLYVYATVTGTAAPSSSYVDGLQYLYFNVNGAASGPAGATGSITAATPSTLFGGGAFNQTTTAPGAGAQGGAISSITTSPSIVVGSNTSLGSIAKPRSAGATYWSSSTGSGSNVVVSGNSVSFLVETLTYKPNSAAVLATPSTPGAANSLAFNVSIPSVSTIGGVDYVGANYFVGLPSVPSLGSQPSATQTGNVSSGSAITVTNAQIGDINLDGDVNIADFNVLAGNFNTPTSGWTNGDLDDNGVVNIADFNLLAGNFNTTLGVQPSGEGSPTALIGLSGALGSSAVPEPASGLLLAAGAAAGLLRRRKAVENSKV